MAVQLLGREREQAFLRGLLVDLRRGVGGMALVYGEPGIGKTALCRWLAEQATDCTVVKVRGSEADASLAFAGVHDLLRPFLRHLPTLPVGQQAALVQAIGLARPAVVPLQPLAVFGGAMALLTEAASHGPVLVIVDDVQWLDASSQQALGFIGRRLADDPVVIVLTAREGALAGVPVDRPLEVRGLDSDAVQRLVAEQTGETVDAERARRLAAATRGNPLALVMLARSADVDGAPAGMVEPLPLSTELRGAFTSRVRVLPEATRDALALLAVEGRLEAGVLSRVLTVAGLDEADLVAAEDAGIVQFEEGVLSFVHPLVRSAVYHDTGPQQRRSAHACLARSLPEGSDRRLWHLAAAATGPDPVLAASLAALSERSAHLGGHLEAAAAAERAAQLSPPGDGRARLLLRAATLRLWAGDPSTAERRCSSALASAASPSTRALVRQVEGHLAISCGNLEEAHELLFRASTAEADDAALALHLRTEAAMPLVMRGDVAKAAALTAEAAALAAEVTGPETVFHAAFRAHLRTLSGQAPARAARAAVDRCIETFAERAATMPAGSLIVHTMAQALVCDGDLLGARDLLTRTVADARRVGALGMLPPVLASLADVYWWLGAWTRAYVTAGEALELAAETGQRNQRPYSLVVLARIEAGQGHPAVEAHAAEAGVLVEQMGSYSLRRYIAAVRGFAALGAGDPQAAVHQLEQVAEGVTADGMQDPSLIPWAPDLVEAYVSLERTEDAERAATQLQRQAHDSGHPWAAAAAWRCRGLLVDDANLDEPFARAMALHEQLPLPFERARTELCWGQRLRRVGRRRDAAHHLGRAESTFDALDATPWAQRVRVELRACGSPVKAPQPGAVHQLTLQEAQVAQHAAEGLTNREIAARLFVSPKTVENHLGRIYSKLGVRSRTELAVVWHRHHDAQPTP